MSKSFKGLLKPKLKPTKIQLGIFIAVFAVVGGAILLLSHAAPNPNLPGDLNNDNIVNASDLSIMLTNFGTTNSTADINGDGKDNILDMSILLTHYGQTYTPPTSSSIYWGAYMDGNDTYSYYYGNPAPNGQNWMDAPWGNTGNTWDRFEQNAGKKVSIVHYGQPNPWNQTTFYGSTADIASNRGALDMIDMSSDSTALTDITNKVYDTQITTWANNVKTWGKPFFLRWDWEMNGTWFNWGALAKTNPTDYVKSWQHFHDVVTAAGATNVTWVWCPNVEPGDSVPLSSLYPGDSYVDWTCMDGYNQGSTTKTFSSIFQQTYNDILSIAPTKPMMIGETSSHEFGGTKASWITDALSTQLPKNFPKIKALVWFNWRNLQNGTYNDWPIESSSTSQAAFKAGIASSYYEPGSSSLVNLPKLTKVPPLP